MRLFIAINFTDRMESAVTEVMRDLKRAGVRGSYVPVQNLHMTLAFLGEADDAAPVKEAMRGISWEPFRLSLTGIGNFGSLVWLGMDGHRELAELVKDVRSALDRAGIAYDRKKFVPHITLIRRAAGTWHHIQVPKAAMTIRKISLMKSEQIDGKRVYTELFAIGPVICRKNIP